MPKCVSLKITHVVRWEGITFLAVDSQENHLNCYHYMSPLSFTILLLSESFVILSFHPLGDCPKMLKIKLIN